jgi:hypothetical protein
MSGDVDLLRRVYERFNARDIDGVLAFLHGDVVWANGQAGGHVRGHLEVRSYWTRQWAMIDPHVEPVGFSAEPGTETVVRIHQTVRDLAGKLLADKMIDHVFRVEDGLIRRFDIRAITE